MWMFYTWHIAATPKNIAGTFQQAGPVVQWDMKHEYPMAIITPELADQAEDVFLHEHVKAEREDEVALHEDFDLLEMDLEWKSEQIIRAKLKSRDLKHCESEDPLTEGALVPAPEPTHFPSTGICKPKKFTNVSIRDSAKQNDVSEK
jgi:hypothetical protein